MTGEQQVALPCAEHDGPTVDLHRLFCRSLCPACHSRMALVSLRGDLCMHRDCAARLALALAEECGPDALARALAEARREGYSAGYEAGYHDYRGAGA
ncbi:MAG TPA: hypothetical protein VKV02_14505 [Acidobacteriaceae bacterium]|nr:hypothetical protein [Acidobacteriaceae bacterium]